MPDLLRLIVPGIIVLLVLSACSRAPVGVAMIDGVSPGSATIGESAEVRVFGRNFTRVAAEVPEGSALRGVEVEVCGAPLTDLKMGATETVPVLLPPGVVINLSVSGELYGRLGPGSVAGVSDVVVTLARGERLVLEDAFECLPAVAGNELRIEPQGWAGYPDGPLTLTALLHGDPAAGTRWEVTGGQLVKRGHQAVWHPPAEPGFYYVSVGVGELTAISELEVLDRQQLHVRVPGPVGLTGFDVHENGRIVLSAQRSEYGVAYVYDPLTGGLEEYGADSFASYRVKLNDIAWDGAQLLAVGESTYNRADGQSVVIDIDPARLVPGVSWLAAGGAAAQRVVVTPQGERYFVGQADQDVFLGALTPDGSGVAWSQSSGGSGADWLSAATAGPDESLLLTGFTQGPDFEGHAVADSAFLLSFATGSRAVEWTKFFSDTVITYVYASPSGMVYVSGAQAGEAWAASFDPQGAPLWEANFSGWTMASGIVTADDEAVYVTGTDTTGTYPDGFVARLDGSGNPVWMYEVDPTAMTSPLGAALAPDGSVIVIGSGDVGAGLVWLAP